MQPVNIFANMPEGTHAQKHMSMRMWMHSKSIA